MHPLRFDPFNNRQARDIRNRLSKSFLQALDQKDGSIFRSRAADYLQQAPDKIYIRYINNRLEKYEACLTAIIRKEAETILEKAAMLWKQQLFFELHELLEDDWKESEGQYRLALQGLIRAAGMKIHAENNNMKAAISMAAKARETLRKYSQEIESLDVLDDILAELDKTLAAAASR